MQQGINKEHQLYGLDGGIFGSTLFFMMNSLIHLVKTLQIDLSQKHLSVKSDDDTPQHHLRQPTSYPFRDGPTSTTGLMEGTTS